MIGRVLIADDAGFMRVWLREILTQEGIEIVAEVTNGDEALEAYTRLRPDVVVLDVSMPPRSGVDALRAIRAFDPSARVVMRSARGKEMLVMEALREGALDFIVKPLHPASVISTLRTALEKDR